MVPPVRSRAARFAVPQWRFRRNARDRKGELANPKGLTEGLWVSCRNGQPITGHLLLHPTYNPSASHSLSTSPYTGEARGGGRAYRMLSPAPQHPWLPLTRELSPQATEGENSQPVSSGHLPLRRPAVSLPPSNPPGLPPPSSEGGKARDGGRRRVPSAPIIWKFSSPIKKSLTFSLLRRIL